MRTCEMRLIRQTSLLPVDDYTTQSTLMYAVHVWTTCTEDTRIPTGILCSIGKCVFMYPVTVQCRPVQVLCEHSLPRCALGRGGTGTGSPSLQTFGIII